MRFDYGSIVPWVRQVDGRWHAVAGPEGLELFTPVRLSGPRQDLVGALHRRRGRTGAVRARLVSFPRSASRSRRRGRVDRARPRSTGSGGRRAAPTRASGASRCSVRCSPSRRSRSSRPAASSPRRPPRFRSRSADRATGTTASVGCATRRSPSRPSSSAGSNTRRCAGASGCCSPRPAIPPRCRRCTASRANAGSPSSSSTGSPVTRDHIRCAPATAPTPNSNSTCTASSSTCCGRRRARARRRARTSWSLALLLLGVLEDRWREPDEGIWEVRGGRRQFTHSKVLCWVAFDRAIAMVEQAGYDGPVERWREIRDEIHAKVCDARLPREAGRVHAVLRYRRRSTRRCS